MNPLLEIKASKPNKAFNGMTPSEVMKAYMPWVDASTLANVISLELDLAHFIKLVPRKERPKGQTNVGLTSGIHFDGETGKTSIVNESSVQYDKQFPDYATLLNGLTVYSAIRDLYDVDGLGFGCAITLYIRQLAFWTKNITIGPKSSPILSLTSKNINHHKTHGHGSRSICNCLHNT